MAELYLVRHGQASFRSDNYDKLSPLGHQQAQWLGEYFRQRNLQVDSILTGTLVRHRETAEGIAQGLQLSSPDFKVFEGLNEFDFHSLINAYIKQHPAEALDRNAPAADFYKLLKKGMQKWSSGELSEGVDETWQHFEERVRSVIETLQAEFHGQKIVAVSSGGAIAMVLRQILQAPSQTVIELNLQIKNTAIAHCYFNPKALRMTSFNHVPHLDTPEREQHITYS
ncbi:histidine phosphatase family protein [Aestuariicella hydrocarbonica]|uniref:Histidine phosphatase family protein n=1 Tax=Pseudomaricurvus hydrocarbonicus TaxID=1470433 RepID=A0A9E5JZH8_9GAMM|nr:histidine phosphatase family protein [Aestuariicella hydrocarbonica]NHO65462.1 histidine phosphatase family protein [Aestuariicella hydrocarbonica]